MVWHSVSKRMIRLPEPLCVLSCPQTNPIRPRNVSYLAIIGKGPEATFQGERSSVVR